MFAVTCPTTGLDTLIFASDVHGVRNTPAGIAMEFRCGCGATGLWLTGRDIHERLLVHRSVSELAPTAA